MSDATNSAGTAGLHKPTTRNSIRLSLGLASKALGDIINKTDVDKPVKKKSSNSQKTNGEGSTISPPIPRTSTSGSPKNTIKKDRVASPADEKPAVKKSRRLSALQNVSGAGSSSEERSASATESPSVAGSTRTSTSSVARPRRSTTSSALPKYRPKSIIADVEKKSSPPTRSSVRKRHNPDDDESEAKQDRPSPTEKMHRSISPLPLRATTFNVKIAAAILPSHNPEGRSLIAPKSSTSPSRPTKIVKTGVPRPSSAGASSTTSPLVNTPSSSMRNVTNLRKGEITPVNRAGSPLRQHSATPRNESPLASYSRQSASQKTPSRTGLRAAQAQNASNMSHISEANDEDSDGENDVALLLAPVAPLGAPTPAMPRTTRARPSNQVPKTPTRSSKPTNSLPTRANLSYLSPLPPDSQERPSTLRPHLLSASSSRATRGSILSWEQLASESSQTIPVDELGALLSEVDAPFIPSAKVSPSPSILNFDLPESPQMNMLHSPGGGYGSISQVLLPDVTPSPAVRYETAQYELNELPPVDVGGVTTLLRLQLASADAVAKDRLRQMQAMEEEIHHLKAARVREEEARAKEVSHLRAEIQKKLIHQEQEEEERSAYTAALEDQLRHDQASMEQVVQSAVAVTELNAKRVHEEHIRRERKRGDLVCRGQAAVSAWTCVGTQAQGDLEVVRADMELLAVLLSGLEQAHQFVSQTCA